MRNSKRKDFIFQPINYYLTFFLNFYPIPQSFLPVCHCFLLRKIPLKSNSCFPNLSSFFLLGVLLQDFSSRIASQRNFQSRLGFKSSILISFFLYLFVLVISFLKIYSQWHKDMIILFICNKMEIAYSFLLPQLHQIKYIYSSYP